MRGRSIVVVVVGRACWTGPLGRVRGVVCALALLRLLLLEALLLGVVLLDVDAVGLRAKGPR